MVFFDIHFLNIYYFLVPLLGLFLIYYLFQKHKKNNYFSFFDDIKKVYTNNYSFRLKVIIISFIFILYTIILSNPNLLNSKYTKKNNGIDIVIALDISYSMEANDFRPSRMEFSKKVLLDFIETQKTNRVGLVVFSGKPFTSIPLTFDYSILKEYISDLGVNNINQNTPGLGGTAIGDAILMSRNLFNLDENREKVIILITDGEANVGVDPLISSQYVNEDNIKIYTIGVGSKNGGEIVIGSGLFEQRYLVEPLNDENLKKISSITSGEYFKAENEKTFNDIFNYLEKLEKSDIEVEIKKEYEPLYSNFVYFLLILLFGFSVYSMKRIEF